MVSAYTYAAVYVGNEYAGPNNWSVVCDFKGNASMMPFKKTLFRSTRLGAETISAVLTQSKAVTMPDRPPERTARPMGFYGPFIEPSLDEA